MHRPVDLSLKAARVEKGFTQEALAEKLGVSKRTLVSWENGDVELKPLVLYAMAYVFQMDADYLRVPDKR
ncbi:helix-turn-helix transcriptional regulator [Bacillus sp. FJAT-50079]|uniref:helix-turn-helix transcriptional regulator n=1 Tax=Bacillus sp. FJAT-50079 TaxID=2833577 RepID=UPI001BCA1222|nr:helix-turn-helix transcriptional regulator [Bacillus sp. FJAT-50079]MBS4210461.1 helix-turn-helix transcriptional regulator [Bacillus sp. FJAT-50079]